MKFTLKYGIIASVNKSDEKYKFFEESCSVQSPVYFYNAILPLCNSLHCSCKSGRDLSLKSSKGSGRGRVIYLPVLRVIHYLATEEH